MLFINRWTYSRYFIDISSEKQNQEDFVAYLNINDDWKLSFPAFSLGTVYIKTVVFITTLSNRHQNIFYDEEILHRTSPFFVSTRLHTQLKRVKYLEYEAPLQILF